jgi:hypothetical protein
LTNTKISVIIKPERESKKRKITPKERGGEDEDAEKWYQRWSPRARCEKESAQKTLRRSRNEVWSNEAVTFG